MVLLNRPPLTAVLMLRLFLEIIMDEVSKGFVPFFPHIRGSFLFLPNINW